MPDTFFALIEGTQKKAKFLKEAAATMGLKNVHVHPIRSEEAAEYLRESQNIVTARGVAELAFLVEWSMPLLKAGGLLLAMKGPKLQQEIPTSIRARQLCGGGEPVVHPASPAGDLPGLENHVIAIVKKTGQTHAKYPRPVSAAKGKPL
jgi:16S rRNA (guanine527-N7)-methyltransferase